jgi:hypothetical protein
MKRWRECHADCCSRCLKPVRQLTTYGSTGTILAEHGRNSLMKNKPKIKYEERRMPIQCYASELHSPTTSLRSSRRRLANVTHPCTTSPFESGHTEIVCRLEVIAVRHGTRLNKLRFGATRVPNREAVFCLHMMWWQLTVMTQRIDGIEKIIP